MADSVVASLSSARSGMKDELMRRGGIRPVVACRSPWFEFHGYGLVLARLSRLHETGLCAGFFRVGLRAAFFPL